MCGRYVSATPASKLAEEFHVEEVKADDLPEKFNVAPTDQVYAVAVSRDGLRMLGSMKWGLVPSWAKDPAVGNRMINARAETLSDKPSFRRLLERRRCILPADGFYEWQKKGEKGQKGKGRKQPFYVRRADGKPLALAALWDVWKPRDDPEADWLRSCTIITGEPNKLVARIHDRMPVILPEEVWDTWLDPENHDVEALTKLLVPYPADRLVAYPIGTDVNSVENEGAHLIEPLEGHEPT